jgi:cytochrome c peroxidase
MILKRVLSRPVAIAIAVLLGFAGASGVQVHAQKQCPPGLEADAPTVPLSMEQVDIDAGVVSFKEIVEHGKNLFVARFNRCDGSGRPLTTGGGDARAFPTLSEEGEALSMGQIEKLRTSAPDSDACAGCHAQPEVGGAGDFVANVFVLAQTLDPVTLSVSPTRSNSRNTLGMHGSGAIEMLTREMTTDLQAQAGGLPDGIHVLTTKGVDFTVEVSGGAVVATDGGVDADLVVKPFHQAGKVISLREFSTNAMNHHHGMQAEERFDLNPAKGFDPDYDGDGMERELTIGDQTAISIFQAQLNAPQQILPHYKADRDTVALGEQVFSDVGCASCHMPELVLNDATFVEPNPFNPPGTCAGAADGCPDYSFDLIKETGLEKGPTRGSAIVRAYTDLKRHTLCDAPGPDAIRFYCNEVLAQGRADAIDGTSGTEFFLTRKLWDVGNTAPYGHRGDVSTITEAILFHGGEGRASRDAFAAASADDQKALVTFLKTLQIVTEGDENSQ